VGNEEILKKRKENFDKESAEFLERMKLESEIAHELNKLSNVNPQQVNSVLEKYRDRIDSLLKENLSSFHKLEEEI
jgi:hypothetical protein